MAYFKQKQIDPGIVFSLRELTAKDMERAGEQSKKSGLAVVHSQSGMFDYFIVASVGKDGRSKMYEVTRLGFMSHCTCKAFELGHDNMCKHIAICLPKVCVHCLERQVPEIGRKCDECFHLTEGFMRRAA